MDNKLQNSISTKELYREYNWYQHTFPELVQNSCDAFFDKNFKLSFIGLSKNINCLLNNESCFVTKVKIDEEYEMFFRLTDSAIDVILNKVLGKSKHRFNINKISDLEAKVITSFNGFMFSALKEQLNNPNPTELKRTNFDVVHLTFLLEDTDEYIDKTGKIIITLPLALLSPEEISSTGDKFSEDEFPNSETMAKVLVGKTRFSLFDLKNLETDDVVVFEDSDIENLTLSIQGEEMAVNINPNMDLLIPETDDGGDNMGETHKNIWDSIEVDMYAEFDAVKVTLGELKNIESGLVVDLTSLYDNKVTLKVEGKPIAKGSLVIVNDRYGVKVDEVIAQGGKSSTAVATGDENSEEEYSNDEESTDETNYTSEDENEVPAEGEENDENGENGEEDFDYSDFELEDENI